MHDTNWMVKGQMLADYLEACKTADLSNFKRDPRLTAIFEHTSVYQGHQYLEFIEENMPAMFGKPFTNDLYGNPIQYPYKAGILVSPSTLQYIAVLVNLIQLCGSMDGLRIVEVGGGYGGQCRTILDVFKPRRYTIFDLEEVVVLQMKYLKHEHCVYWMGRADAEYDLFISNYALSEIKDNAEYIELASRCKHGYITCNTDFVTLPWEHTRTEDITKEPNNYILKW